MHPKVTHSFMVIISDKNRDDKFLYELPISAGAFFANKIVKELQGTQEQKGVSELWYQFIPHCTCNSVKEDFLRNDSPEGITQLFDEHAELEKEFPFSFFFHPDPHILFFTVKIMNYDIEIFSSMYSVDDIFYSLGQIIVKYGLKNGNLSFEDAPFYYRIEISSKMIRSMPYELFPKEAFQVEGVFPLPMLSKDHQPTIFNKIPPPPLPMRDLEIYGKTEVTGRGSKGNGTVLMSVGVFRELKDNITLSSQVENGGYLLGTPFRQLGSPEDENAPGFKWLVDISEVIQAEGGYGTPVALLFTGESWSKVTRRKDQEFPQKRIVSWYHTHLFKATDDFGLSGLDQVLHSLYFSKPWQIAILLNLDEETGEREIRCFQRGEDGWLVESIFELYEP